MANKKGTTRKASLTINSRPTAGGKKKSLPSTKAKIPGSKRKPTKADKETNKQVDKVEAVKVLVSKYEMTNIDALLAYDKFFKAYPSGEIKKEQFLEEYKDDIMAEAFFRTFDEDNSGSLSFYEYMLVKTAPNLDKVEDRLGWLFSAFDNDGGGSIDDSEVLRIVEAFYRMSGRDEVQTKPEEDEENDDPDDPDAPVKDVINIDDCVEDILLTCDVDGDGVITKEEFIENAMNSKFIAVMMGQNIKD